MTFGSGSGWWNDISVKLNCVLAGRPVRLFLQALCIFGLHRFSAGRSDALRAWVCHRHAGDLRHYICSVVCCKNRVCRLAFASCCGW